MKLVNRRRLARLMAIQDVSQRELAKAAGWRSHAYMGRLLRGEVDTLDTTPALRIADYLGVPTDDLFELRMTTASGRSVAREVAA